MGEDLRPCRSGHEDRISGLPDELLHDILEHLHCARAAARTSVLSRRWRHLWRHMPELNLVAPPATILDTVESALAGYSVPTLEILGISVWPDDPKYRFRVAAERVARWLRFAVEHGVEYLRLNVPLGIVEPEVTGEEEAVLELPVLQRAKKIRLMLGRRCQLRLREPGLFTALTDLVVERVRMEGSELTAVCTQCPRLRYINLFLLELIAVSDVSVHSNSLVTIIFFEVRNARRLEVVAPSLEHLRVGYATEAYISAPKLAKLSWFGDAYDPQHHRFAGIGRCLQQLEISKTSLIASLIRQFDEVDELKLRIHISVLEVAGYQSFLNDTNKLPKCKTLRISLSSGDHGLLPIILHLLRTCNSIKKCAIRLQEGYSWDPSFSLGYCCPPSCPCRLQESQKIDSSALSSLEEVELSGFTNCLKKLELVEFLSCNATNLKRLVIEYMELPNPPPNIKEVCEKVRRICHPNVKVEFYLYHFLSPIPVD